MRQNKVFPPLPSRPQPNVPPPRQVSRRDRLSNLANRFRSVLLVVISVPVTLALVYAYDLSKPPAQHLTQRDIDAAVERTLETIPPKPSVASQAYEVIRPSVVAVQALIKQADGTTDGSLGTGVIVDQDGVIVTSLHIIADAEEIRVIFADGSESEAAVLGTEPENDLAVLHAPVIPDDL
ncbi:MAG: trypsin-like peptidase domain-containing protein, partial [Dehalococcoidales bacterium]|nr:trypsin-like peptidase domain-containing protein [Dehalococcoidales bacterium]